MSGTTLVRQPAAESRGKALCTVIGLAGTFVLLPVQMFQLPSQMDVVDLWIVALLSIFWTGFIFGRQTLIKPCAAYMVAMWFILVASLASSFAAVDHTSCLMVVLKEVYLFVTFVTLATLLSKLSARDFRFVMSVWLGAVVLHGLIILLEFLQPSVFRYIAGLAGQSMSYEHFRPSGLFFSPKAGNANKAAVFQLLGFVPLGLARPSRRVATVLGIVLLSSILATGSMGTTLSFIAGFVAAVVAIAVLGNHVVLVTKLVMRSMIAVVLLGGLLFVVIGNNQDYQEHFESIIFGRAQKSSEGRFTLWERGLETLQESNTLLWGLGPENFRDVDVLEKQLHNDVLAFSVERGLLGVLGLVLLAAFAMARAVRLFKLGCKYPQHVGLTTVVVLATFVSVLVVSLTHQVFHCREIWLVLASQEALLVHYGRAPAIAMPRIGLVQSHECWGKS